MINFIAQFIFIALEIFIEKTNVSYISYQCAIITIHFKHNITWLYLWTIMDRKLIAITIVFHNWKDNCNLYRTNVAIKSEITLNITYHGSNWNRLLRHFIPQWLLMINMNTQSFSFCISEINFYYTYHTNVTLCQKSFQT